MTIEWGRYEGMLGYRLRPNHENGCTEPNFQWFQWHAFESDMPGRNNTDRGRGFTWPSGMVQLVRYPREH